MWTSPDPTQRGGETERDNGPFGDLNQFTGPAVSGGGAADSFDSEDNRATAVTVGGRRRKISTIEEGDESLRMSSTLDNLSLVESNSFENEGVDQSARAVASKFLKGVFTSLLWRHLASTLMLSFCILDLLLKQVPLAELSGFGLAVSLMEVLVANPATIVSAALNIVCPATQQAGHPHAAWKYFVKGGCVATYSAGLAILCLLGLSPLLSYLAADPALIDFYASTVHLLAPSVVCVYISGLCSRFINHNGFLHPGVIQNTLEILFFAATRICAPSFIDDFMPSYSSILRPHCLLALSYSVGSASGCAFLIVWMVLRKFDLGWQSGVKIYLYQLYGSRSHRLAHLYRRQNRFVVDFHHCLHDLPEDLGEQLLQDNAKEREEFQPNEPAAEAVLQNTNAEAPLPQVTTPPVYARRQKRVSTRRPGSADCAKLAEEVSNICSAESLGMLTSHPLETGASMNSPLYLAGTSSGSQQLRQEFRFHGDAEGAKSLPTSSGQHMYYDERTPVATALECLAAAVDLESGGKSSADFSAPTAPGEASHTPKNPSPRQLNKSSDQLPARSGLSTPLQSPLPAKAWMPIHDLASPGAMSVASSGSEEEDVLSSHQREQFQTPTRSKKFEYVSGGSTTRLARRKSLLYSKRRASSATASPSAPETHPKTGISSIRQARRLVRVASTSSVPQDHPHAGGVTPEAEVNLTPAASLSGPPDEPSTPFIRRRRVSTIRRRKRTGSYSVKKSLAGDSFLKNIVFNEWCCIIPCAPQLWFAGGCEDVSRQLNETYSYLRIAARGSSITLPLSVMYHLLVLSAAVCSPTVVVSALVALSAFFLPLQLLFAAVEVSCAHLAALFNLVRASRPLDGVTTAIRISWLTFGAVASSPFFLLAFWPHYIFTLVPLDLAETIVSMLPLAGILSFLTFAAGAIFGTLRGYGEIRRGYVFAVSVSCALVPFVSKLMLYYTVPENAFLYTGIMFLLGVVGAFGLSRRKGLVADT